MICRECRKDFESDRRPDDITFLGECENCRTKYKYDNAIDGAITGSALGFASNPFFLITFFNWELLLASGSVLTLSSLAAWFYFKRKGKVTFNSVIEAKKPQRVQYYLSFIAMFVLNAAFTIGAAFIFISL
jgi:hypothetical protein